jgi:hypothetical protein
MLDGAPRYRFSGHLNLSFLFHRVIPRPRTPSFRQTHKKILAHLTGEGTEHAAPAFVVLPFACETILFYLFFSGTI